MTEELLAGLANSAPLLVWGVKMVSKYDGVQDKWFGATLWLEWNLSPAGESAKFFETLSSSGQGFAGFRRGKAATRRRACIPDCSDRLGTGFFSGTRTVG